MHLAKDILKGKFGSNKSLKREAREEMAEYKGGKSSKERMKYFKAKGPLKDKLSAALKSKMC